MAPAAAQTHSPQMGSASFTIRLRPRTGAGLGRLVESVAVRRPQCCQSTRQIILLETPWTFRPSWRAPSINFAVDNSIRGLLMLWAISPACPASQGVGCQLPGRAEPLREDRTDRSGNPNEFRRKKCHCQESVMQRTSIPSPAPMELMVLARLALKRRRLRMVLVEVEDQYAQFSREIELKGIPIPWLDPAPTSRRPKAAGSLRSVQNHQLIEGF